MPLKTLQDAFAYFSDRQRCVDYVVKMRWPDGKVGCPTCGSENVTWLPTRFLWQCKNRHPKRQFSVKVGTIMEDSPIPLGKWLIIMWMIAGCRNGISSYEVARTVGLTQKSAWFLLHRLRNSMQDNSIVLDGIVEVDESYVGPNVKNKHVSKRKQGYQKEKTPVIGMIERGGRVVATVIPTTHSKVVVPIIEASIDKSSLVISDNYSIYDPLRKRGFNHEVINHTQDQFKVGNVYTNTIESYWSVLKRMLRGTYISVTPKHLQAYVTEQSFRHNVRKGFTEEQRLHVILHGTTGKRLTYAALTGKVAV